MRTLTDRLDELAAEFGVYLTDQLSVRVDDLTDQRRAMARLRAATPAALLDEPVTEARTAARRRRGDHADRRPGWWSGPRAPSRSSRHTWRWSSRSARQTCRRPADARGALTALRTEVAAALGI